MPTFNHSQFVAHPNVQQLLGAIWYQGLPGFRRRTVVGQLLTIGTIAAQFPLYSMAYIIAPISKRGQFLKQSMIKFICHSASYLFFLCKFITSNPIASNEKNIFHFPVNN